MGVQHSPTVSHDISFAAYDHFNTAELSEDLAEKDIAQPTPRFPLDMDTRQTRLLNNNITFSTGDQFHAGGSQLG